MTEFSFDLYSMPVSLYVAFLSKQQPHNTGNFVYLQDVTVHV